MNWQVCTTEALNWFNNKSWFIQVIKQCNKQIKYSQIIKFNKIKLLINKKNQTKILYIVIRNDETVLIYLKFNIMNLVIS